MPCGVTVPDSEPTTSPDARTISAPLARAALRMSA
jgi:hypothetical protein